MPFTVRYRGYEIECPSGDEAAALVDRLQRDRARVRRWFRPQTTALIRALRRLQEHGPLRSAQLASAMGVHPKALGNVTRQLTEFVEARNDLTFDDVLRLERHGSASTWIPGPRMPEVIALLATQPGGAVV